MLYKLTKSFGIEVNRFAEEDSEELCDLENSHFYARFRSFASKKKLKEEQKKSKLKHESLRHDNRSEESHRNENKEEEKETKELEFNVTVELESIAHYSEAYCPSEIYDYGVVFQHSEINGNSIDLRTKKNIMKDNLPIVHQGRKIGSSESKSSVHSSLFKSGDSSNGDNQSIIPLSSNPNSNQNNLMENKKVESVDYVHLNFEKNCVRKEEEEEKKNRRYNKVLEKKELIIAKEKLFNENREKYLNIKYVDIQFLDEFTMFVTQYVQNYYEEDSEYRRAHYFATELYDTINMNLQEEENKNFPQFKLDCFGKKYFFATEPLQFTIQIPKSDPKKFILEKAKIILEKAQGTGKYRLISKANDIALMFSLPSPENKASWKAQICINDRSPLIWELIKKYSECDKRLPILIKFIICWGARRGIINPEKGYFTSQALILLLISFLQIIRKPVLQCLHYEMRIQNCRKIPKNMVNYEETERSSPGLKNVDCSKWITNNHESVGVLLVRFFYYYGEIDYPEHMKKDQRRISVTETKYENYFGRDLGCPIFVEDPFDEDCNLTGNISMKEYDVILYELRMGYKSISEAKEVGDLTYFYIKYEG